MMNTTESDAIRLVDDLEAHTICGRCEGLLVDEYIEEDGWLAGPCQTLRSLRRYRGPTNPY